MNRARAEGFTLRSASAWATACAAALPADARQLIHEAHAQGGLIDPAEAFIARAEQKTEAQARSKSRRQKVKGWGTGARPGEEDEQAEAEPQALPGAGEWAFRQDPAAAREALEIRSAVEACDAIAVLEMLGLAGLAADPVAVARLKAEMRRWEAEADLDEADTRAIARRDGVGVRMVQIALQTQREALACGQGVLL